MFGDRATILLPQESTGGTMKSPGSKEEAKWRGRRFNEDETRAPGNGTEPGLLKLCVNGSSSQPNFGQALLSFS